MAESENEWVSKRAYALWEGEGYPSGKDSEHWERAKLEYATIALSAAKPVAASNDAIPEIPYAATPRSVSPKAVAAKTAPIKKSALKGAGSEPAKKRSKKIAAE